jgi:hypothetical protein
MAKNYTLIFDDVILHQLKQAGRKKQIRNILSQLFDKIETLGPRAGKLVDSHVFIYEIKLKSPPMRLYFQHRKDSTEIGVFEYEMKTSKKKQKRTIGKLKRKASKS